MELSIVVPVYNVKDYLSECISSIVDQFIENISYEVLIVDDGSYDGSSEIAIKASLEFQNIKYFYQDNLGLSAARNKGLKEAIGKFIWFIDSDDWIQKDCLEKVIAICIKESLDILSIERAIVSNNQTYIQKIDSHLLNQTLSGIEIIKENKFEIPAQLYIFNREFLTSNNLSFYVGLLHEDKEFTIRAIFLSKRFRYFPLPIYFHRNREGSITNVINPKRCFDLLTVAEAVQRFKEMRVTNTSVRKIFDLHCFFSITLSCILARSINIFERNKLFKQIESNRNFFYRILISQNYIYKIQALIILISPLFFAKLYLLLKRKIY